MLVVRLGDTLREYGGEVIEGHPTRGGPPIACVGDAVRCNQHGMTHIVEGSELKQIEGQPVALHGHRCACGCTLVSSEPDRWRGVKRSPSQLWPLPSSKGWVTNGALFCLVSLGIILWAILNDFPGYSFLILLFWPVSAFVILVWAVLLQLHGLYFNRDVRDVKRHNHALEQQLNAWWAKHVQSTALIESVLLGPACEPTQAGTELFLADHTPPAPQMLNEGLAVRVPGVQGESRREREAQLAITLGFDWRALRSEKRLSPQRCYWAGSQASWETFVKQMAHDDGTLQLPRTPEPWHGIETLNLIIDQLQGASADTRILCAGCHSSEVTADSALPAGEAAFLWWLGPKGPVRIGRGEGYDAATDALSAVLDRAVKHGGLNAPTPQCVSFSQPDISDLSTSGWNLQSRVIDACFGALPGFQLPVVLTLAARQAQAHGAIISWLSDDPRHTLALGLVHGHVGQITSLKTPINLPEPQSCPQ